jgi:hypothetical protein
VVKQEMSRLSRNRARSRVPNKLDQTSVPSTPVPVPSPEISAAVLSPPTVVTR